MRYSIQFKYIYLLEVVSRYRDQQVQVGENCSYLHNLHQIICQFSKFNVFFFLQIYEREQISLKRL